MNSRRVFCAGEMAVGIVLLAAGVSCGNIINPGFEDGLNGWTVSGTFASVTGPKTPTDGVRYAASTVLAPAGGHGRIEQTFTLPADAGILWCDIQGLVTNGSFNADMVLPGGAIVPLWIQPPNSWHGNFVRHAYDVSPYAGMPVTLVFQTDAGHDCSAELYIDRILLEPLPEPAALVLMTIGSAFIATVRFSRR